MKRIMTILCALILAMAGSAAALAADTAEAGQSASYYPISVEEYTHGDLDELRINKTYQLSLADDPSLIPTEDFVRNGRRYYLLDMTRKDEVGVDIQTHTETVTQASDTNSLEAILQRLDAEMEVTTEDGYVGILRLDHTSVQVTTDGYATKTNTLSASRSYPNLSEADTSLIPKTIEDKGKTLTLGDVKWSESMDVDGEGSSVTRYTATASYTGTASPSPTAPWSPTPPSSAVRRSRRSPRLLMAVRTMTPARRRPPILRRIWTRRRSLRSSPA